MKNKLEKDPGIVRLKHETMDMAKLHHKEAIAALKKINESRKGKRYKLIPIDWKTWKEVEF